MKISLAFTFVILALGVVWALRTRGQWQDLSSQYEILSAEARALGIDPDSPASSASPRRGHGMETEMKTPATLGGERQARELVGKLVTFVTERRERHARGIVRDDSHDVRVLKLALAHEMMTFEPSQFHHLMDELEDSTKLDGGWDEELENLALMIFAENHPAAAMAWLDQQGRELGSEHMILDGNFAKMLLNWTREDPAAALGWLDERGDGMDGSVFSGALRVVITGVAVDDPRLALALVNDLAPADRAGLHERIGALADSPESRTELLAILREGEAGTEDATETSAVWRETLNGIATSLFREDFESSSSWLAESGLSPEELLPLVHLLEHEHVGSDFVKWFDWFGSVTTDERQLGLLSSPFRNWVSYHHLSASLWLDEAPPGPLRDSALEGYIQATSTLRPELAAARIHDLPAGPARDRWVRQIHQHWHREDPAAAADFAIAHGLDP